VPHLDPVILQILNKFFALCRLASAVETLEDYEFASCHSQGVRALECLVGRQRLDVAGCTIGLRFRVAGMGEAKVWWGQLSWALRGGLHLPRSFPACSLHCPRLPKRD
jgi:hypothetical protein